MGILYALYVYVAAASCVAFLLMGFDKRQAKRRGRRVPEKRFFAIGAAGGAIGVWCGMKLWRHKTQHRSFNIGIPYLIGIHIIILILATGFVGMSARG